MKSKTLRMGLAGFGVTALTVSSVLMGGLAATAADYLLGPDDVAGYEVGGHGDTPGYNYDQWHVGSVLNQELLSTDSLDFGECSVTVLGVPENGGQDVEITQVLKGYTFKPSSGVNERPTDPEEIFDAILSTSVNHTEGSVTLQFPFFGYIVNPDDTSGYSSKWAGTWRTPGLQPGEGITEDMVLTNSLPNVPDAKVSDIFEAMAVLEADEKYELLGIGFTGSEGTVVESFSFGGDTYYFGTGDCIEAVEEVEEETPGQGGPEVTAPTKPQRVETAAL